MFFSFIFFVFPFIFSFFLASFAINVRLPVKREQRGRGKATRVGRLQIERYARRREREDFYRETRKSILVVKIHLAQRIRNTGGSVSSFFL